MKHPVLITDVPPSTALEAELIAWLHSNGICRETAGGLVYTGATIIDDPTVAGINARAHLIRIPMPQHLLARLSAVTARYCTATYYAGDELRGCKKPVTAAGVHEGDHGDDPHDPPASFAWTALTVLAGTDDDQQQGDDL